MEHIRLEKYIPVKKRYDVIVCGGGVAGVAAAVSAAKNGLSTLLLEKSNIPFRPGMSASVYIQTEKKDGIVIVPLQAITTRKDLIDSLAGQDKVLQQVFVYDRASNTVKARCIETGIQDMTSIEVTSGLSDTCSIVVAPYTAISRDLKEGSKVTAKTE